MKNSIVIVPGIGGSGTDHWQSHWESFFPPGRRIAPASWEAPDLSDWVAALERAVAQSDGPPVLVCHSLGCLLFAHWHAITEQPIAAALLVAVPDPEGPAFPPRAADFKVLPRGDFRRVPVLAVASSDDPYDPAGRGIRWAKARGAEAQLLGPQGHLNEASGLGEWPAGQALLSEFLGRIDPTGRGRRLAGHPRPRASSMPKRRASAPHC
jgi:uncharacterized protein